MSVLLLVHCEEMFRKDIESQCLRPILRLIKSGKFSDVIHCNSEIDNTGPIDELDGYITEIIPWGWGYEPECFEGQPDEASFVIKPEASLHDFTWIPPELRNWTRGPITLGGGCQGECLADMESILGTLNIPFKTPASLTFGCWVCGQRNYTSI